MTRRKRFGALLLTALILAAVMTSLFVLALETDHNCAGEGCSVCAVIALCRNALKVLCGTLLAAALLFACLRFAAPILMPVRVSSYSKTPITLKVKLLN